MAASTIGSRHFLFRLFVLMAEAITTQDSKTPLFLPRKTIICTAIQHQMRVPSAKSPSYTKRSKSFYTQKSKRILCQLPYYNLFLSQLLEFPK